MRSYWKGVIISYSIIQYCNIQKLNCFLFERPGVILNSLAEESFAQFIIDAQIFEVYEVVDTCCSEPIANSATRETYRMLLNTILIIFKVLIALAS